MRQNGGQECSSLKTQNNKAEDGRAGAGWSGRPTLMAFTLAVMPPKPR